MEELIWKYLDKQCTRDEMQQIENLLASDQAFVSLFEQLKVINAVLEETAEVKMSPAFKSNLINKIQEQIPVFEANNIVILPKIWIIALSMIAIGTIILTVKLSNTGASVLPVSIKIDPVLMTYLGWISIGFLGLTLLDVVLGKISHIRKLTSMLV